MTNEISLVTESQTLDLLKDETGQDIVQAINKQNLLLQVLASDKVQSIDLQTFKKMSREGTLSQIFNVGDQIFMEWTDKSTNTTYNVPLNIVHFGDAELENGEVVHGTYLQWHYTTPVSMCFDEYEAFYVAEEELPAGTYNIRIGDNWGNNCKAGDVYSFTLTKPLPIGGQLSGFYRIPDITNINELKVYSYADNTKLDPIETVSVVKAEEGTNIGTLVSAGNDLNSLHRVGYGYGRYSQSAIRQWLNSDGDVNKWWKSMNKYDRPPKELSTMSGFLSGFNEEFLHLIEKIKITTALNTVIPDDKTAGYDVTYDKIWLPSLEQMYIKSQAPNEGEVFEYWKKASGRNSPCELWKTYPNLITYDIKNHKSAQAVRLRSAHRGNASNAWYVGSTGNIHYANATWTHRCEPVCFL